MAVFALLMLAVGLVVMVTTGWASYAVLLGVACTVAAVGVAGGSIDVALLQALPSRLVGLLEHDLLQAVALYALVGSLLRHTDVADQVYAGFAFGLRRAGVAPALRPALAGYGVGALSAPMNGSVGASVSMLAHTVAPRWRRRGVPAPATTALTAVTATLGVIVPPSLVLLLLGDAMLRAHTESLLLAPASGERVINTQDLIQACTPVAALLALAWAATAAWRARVPAAASGVGNAAGARADTEEGSRPPRRRLAAALVPLAVLALLAGVAGGRLRAVEAAATAGLALLVYAVASGRLPRRRLGQMLDDAMALTGALFALLLAASTLTLELRLAGCDRLVGDALARLAGQPRLALAAVLAGLLLLAFVLDAFEIVFLVVPIVMPPLLAQVPDAAWVACLTLLMLQAGFLLPPWGFAVVLSRSMTGATGQSQRQLALELLPYLAVLAAVAAVVFCFPAMTHWLRTAPMQLESAVPAGASMDDLLRSMARPLEPAASAP
jgi:TRAP-type mannitol/chloroaromatic compound transport system permease large subunit